MVLGWKSISVRLNLLLTVCVGRYQYTLIGPYRVHMEGLRQACRNDSNVSAFRTAPDISTCKFGRMSKRKRRVATKAEMPV